MDELRIALLFVLIGGSLVSFIVMCVSGAFGAAFPGSTVWVNVRNGLPHCPRCNRQVSLRRSYCRACGWNLHKRYGEPTDDASAAELRERLRQARRPQPAPRWVSGAQPAPPPPPPTRSGRFAWYRAWRRGEVGAAQVQPTEQPALPAPPRPPLPARLWRSLPEVARPILVGLGVGGVLAAMVVWLMV